MRKWLWRKFSAFANSRWLGPTKTHRSSCWSPVKRKRLWPAQAVVGQSVPKQAGHAL